MFRFLLCVSLYLLSSIAFASSPCGDFFKYACLKKNQGQFDGTGRVKGRSELVSAITKVTEEEKKRFMGEFLVLLNNNPQLKKKIAFKLGCENQPVNKCLNYGKGVNALAADLFNKRVVINDHGKLKGSSDILEDDYFKTVLKVNYKMAPLLEESRQRIDQKLISVKRRNYAKDNIFPKVKKTIMDILEQLPDGDKKKAILKKVSDVSVQTEFCFEDRQSLESPNATYDGAKNEVNICLNYLFLTDSLFSLVMVVSHEIAHSIDPCGPVSDQIFDPLVQCLNTPRGGAIPSKCSGMSGQMNEMFGDWMGQEVLSRLQKSEPSLKSLSSQQFARGMANFYPFCHNKSYLEKRDGSHPRGVERVNLSVTHPLIRKRMGCDNKPQLIYCPIDGVEKALAPLSDIDRAEAVQ